MAHVRTDSRAELSEEQIQAALQSPDVDVLVALARLAMAPDTRAGLIRAGAIQAITTHLIQEGPDWSNAEIALLLEV
jgi:hypothetical protein